LAAQRDEAVAVVHEGATDLTLADATGRRAVVGHAATGAVPELQRLRDTKQPMNSVENAGKSLGAAGAQV